MKIRLIAFGIAKDILGKGEISYEFTGPPTVENLLSSLNGNFPDFERLASLAVAVNSEYAQGEQQIQESDEVVLIPPVSGG